MGGCFERSRDCDTEDKVSNSHLCTSASYLQAVDLSLKFVPERSVDVVVLVSDRLANIGRYIQVCAL